MALVTAILLQLSLRRLIHLSRLSQKSRVPGWFHSNSAGSHTTSNSLSTAQQLSNYFTLINLVSAIDEVQSHKSRLMNCPFRYRNRSFQLKNRSFKLKNCKFKLKTRRSDFRYPGLTDEAPQPISAFDKPRANSEIEGIRHRRCNMSHTLQRLGASACPPGTRGHTRPNMLRPAFWDTPEHPG